MSNKSILHWLKELFPEDGQEFYNHFINVGCQFTKNSAYDFEEGKTFNFWDKEYTLYNKLTEWVPSLKELQYYSHRALD